MQTAYSMSDYLSIQPASRDPFAVGPREHLNQILSIVAMSRHGDNRFLPLLMNKITEVLPRLANPMLQNAPENSNLANIDIFDGFGNAGMAQPSQMQISMDAEYDRKFPVEDYDKKYTMEMSDSTPESSSNSNNSNSTPPMAQQASDMNGSFVSSPGIMSPGIEYSHNMNGFAVTPMSDMVMSPLGNSNQTSHMGGTQAQHQHQQRPQHMPQMNQAHEQQQSQQHHMSGMNQQNMRSQSISTSSMPTSHPMSAMGATRQIPQRQNSFQFQSQPPMRSVSDFRGLQRGTTDAGSSLVGMNSMGAEMDFSALQ